jgi:hypothetical protein
VKFIIVYLAWFKEPAFYWVQGARCYEG